MEKGIVRSYDKNCGMGMISRSSDVDVKFLTDSVIGRDRVNLAQGDFVWFEVENINNFHVAINIRKCG